MVAPWIAANLYSVRETVASAAFTGPGRPQEAPDAQRSEILEHVQTGNVHYNRGRYRPALDEYRAAHALLLKLLRFDISLDLIEDPRFKFPFDAEILPSMLEVATEYARLGLGLTPQSPFIVPRVFPLSQNLAQRFDATATLAKPGPKLEVAAEAQEIAKAYVRLGDPDRAQAVLGTALKQPGIQANPDAIAEIDLTRAAIAHRQDQPDQVREFVAQARRSLTKSGNRAAIDELADVERRLGLGESPVDDNLRPIDPRRPAIPLNRERLLAESRLAAPARLTDSGQRLKATQVLTTRSVLEAVTAQPTEVVIGIETLPVLDEANRLDVVTSEAKLEFSLGRDDTPVAIIQRLYEPRVGLLTLDGLRTKPKIIGNLIAFAPHYYYFVIPVSLGDCYHQLGHFEQALQQYEIASGYQFLNQPVEAPKLWVKMAKTCLAWGDALYRRNDRAGAQSRYELVLQDNAPSAGSTLYQKGLAGMAAVVEDALEQRDQLIAADPLTAADLPVDPLILSIVIDVQHRLTQLTGNLNALGFADDYVPTTSFEYLQSVARSFAQFAAQANREYIGFRKRAEEESFTMMKLEQASELARKGWDVERERSTAARRDQDAAAAAEVVSNLRTDLAQDNLDTFNELGWENVRLEEALAWANATTEPHDDQIELRYGGLEDLGVRRRYQPRSKLVQELTAKRARRSFEIERGRLANAVAELQASEAVASAQRQAAEARTRAAQLSEEGAQMRYFHSLAELDFMRNAEIDADLYNELAELMKDTAQLYLQRAVEVAFLMERAYEFEHGVQIDRIRFDYGDLDVADGLYAADQLLQDIDYFTFHKVLSARAKPQPAARTISLATEDHLEFLRLRRDGTIRFTTRLQDFQENHPGIYNGRLKQVEIMVEGLVGTTGPIGSLSCGGVSRFRRQDGTIVGKVHSPETMVLSDYRPRRDALVADVPSEVLRTFENVGLETDWVLTFPRHRNDFDFASVTDIRIVVSFLAEHDPDLEAADLAALPAEDEGEIWYSLRFDMAPDAFFLLADGGTFDFAITSDILPRSHADPEVTGLGLIGLKPDGTAQPLTVGFRSDEAGAEADRFASGPTGVVTILSPGAAGPFSGTPVTTGWHLTIDPAENPDLQPAGGAAGTLDLSGLRDLILLIQYRYART
jgi:hypothetical protein